MYTNWCGGLAILTMANNPQARVYGGNVVPHLDDRCMHHILSMLKFEAFSYDWKREDCVYFENIEDVPTRKRMEEYYYKSYLPSLYNDDGSVDEGVCASKIFHQLLYVEHKYYCTSSTAYEVGTFGNFGVFMNYIGDITGDPKQDNCYATAAIIGALANGQIELLEKLSSLGPERFNLHYIACSDFDHHQTSIFTGDYPDDFLVNKDTFLWLLYAALESGVLDVVVWLTRNGPDISGKEVWDLRVVWYENVLPEYKKRGGLDGHPTIDKLVGFRNEVDNWFDNWFR